MTPPFRRAHLGQSAFWPVFYRGCGEEVSRSRKENARFVQRKRLAWGVVRLALPVENQSVLDFVGTGVHGVG